MGEDTLQSRLADDIGRLQSHDPIQRLSAVRKVRALIGTLEETAVAQARSATVRHSWDEIARVMGTTRWSVLRRFGPHGTHQAADPPEITGEGTVVAVEPEGAFRELDTLPPELVQKVILLVGELLSGSVREGRPFSDDPVGIRMQVLPRSIRIELGDTQGQATAGGGDLAPSPVWIELDLPLEALLPGVSPETSSLTLGDA